MKLSHDDLTTLRVLCADGVEPTFLIDAKRYFRGRLAALAQQAQPCGFYAMGDERYGIAQQAQPEIPTRETIANALQNTGYLTTTGGGIINALADAVLALFAPKEQRCTVCDWSTDDANTHPDYDHDFQVSP